MKNLDSNIINVIESENIESVHLCKVYSQYSMRNEWTNWDGDTDLINRSGKNVQLQLAEAERDAERKRKPGTKFFIAELPALHIKSKSGGLIVTELFTKYPLSDAAQFERFHKHITLKEVFHLLPINEWSFSTVIDKSENIDPLDGFYFLRRSSAGAGKNALGWTLKNKEINDSALKSIMLALNNNQLQQANEQGKNNEY